MSIVKIPKKMWDALADIRGGQVADGLERLTSIKGFEPQKALVKAEVYYFQSRYEEALSCDEQALPFDEQWYAGNILTEHLAAYSQVALLNHNVARAEQFLQSFLAAKRNLSLPAHRLHSYEYQVARHLGKLRGEQSPNPYPEPLLSLATGRPLDDFAGQLQQYRPKLMLASAAGADYLLHFVFKQAATEDALCYYSTYADLLSSENHHLTAARLYAQLNRPEQAQQAIRAFVGNAWFPVEATQVVPMRLWEFDELQPILTQQFKQEILALPNAR